MSLKKIAELSGVSVSTVSRVLNYPEGSYASKQVKERVWEAAASIGYEPNLYARNLKKGMNQTKSCEISLIMARSERTQKDAFFEELKNYLQTELLAEGCRIGKVIYAREKAQQKRLEEALPKSDGYIILGKCSGELLAALKKQTEYLVGIWRNPAALPMDEIVCRGDRAAEIAVEYLAGLGHRKIAYIGDCSYENRYVGYHETLIRHRIPIDYPLIRDVRQTKEEGKAAMELLLKAQNVSAVLCANDEIALGVLTAVKESKKRPPVSVISIDDIQAAEAAGLTTIHMPQKDMAHMAVQILLDRMKGGHQNNMCLELPCKLVERDSCFIVS